MEKTTSLPLPGELSLQGKKIAVTGAASGIGRVTAGVLARLGASLLLSDRASLQDVCADLKARGTSVETLEADMTQAGFGARLLSHGPIQGLAHCAAIYHGTPLSTDPDALGRFHRVMDANVRVPMELGLACAEHMASHGGGAIVLIGSVAGRIGGGTSRNTAADYSVSKGAVHTVVRWLSRQVVDRGVLVNGIAPGPIATPMVSNASFDLSQLPLGRMGRPEEIAWVIAFLLSPAASYFSGAILDVNGGTFVG
jgi:3-oxoacyl-[acyl-carrier protein] reductase